MLLILLVGFFIVFSVLVGSYINKIINFEESRCDKVFGKVENLIYRVAKVEKDDMSIWDYIKSLLSVNLVMLLVGFLILRFQGCIPFLNPNNVSNMGSSLSFNTASSFLTNTDLQHYSENGISNFSQMIVITFFMFTSAATGCAVAAGFIRAIAGKRKSLGNFYMDFTRFLIRVLVPMAIIVTVFLIGCGVPQTLKGGTIIKTLEGTNQNIVLGPVASFESIKHIGTNGGGFFGANSAHPFENPNGISNFLEMLCMTILPGAFIYSFGKTIKNKKQSLVLMISLGVLFFVSLGVIVYSEVNGNKILTNLGLGNSLGNLEGKELRFGAVGTAIFSNITTTFTTGSVNSSLDSFMPLGQLGTMWNMMLNTIFGGDGVGFMNTIMYVILTVFICGLMVGRTPEFLGKKIEGGEVKLIALAILVHPIVILLPSAISVMTKCGLDAIPKNGFHGLSQILYQYTSSSANNGSAFGGLSGDTTFWNIATGIVMLLGRFLPIILLIIVAYLLANKKPVPETVGTFRCDNAIFGVMLVFIILIIGALTFLPVLALGPIAGHLTIK